MHAGQPLRCATPAIALSRYRDLGQASDEALNALLGLVRDRDRIQRVARTKRGAHEAARRVPRSPGLRREDTNPGGPRDDLRRLSRGAASRPGRGPSAKSMRRSCQRATPRATQRDRAVVQLSDKTVSRRQRHSNTGTDHSWRADRARLAQHVTTAVQRRVTALGRSNRPRGQWSLRPALTASPVTGPDCNREWSCRDARSHANENRVACRQRTTILRDAR